MMPMLSLHPGNCSVQLCRGRKFWWILSASVECRGLEVCQARWSTIHSSLSSYVPMMSAISYSSSHWLEFIHVSSLHFGVHMILIEDGKLIICAFGNSSWYVAWLALTGAYEISNGKRSKRLNEIENFGLMGPIGLLSPGIPRTECKWCRHQELPVKSATVELCSINRYGSVSNCFCNNVEVVLFMYTPVTWWKSRHYVVLN